MARSSAGQRILAALALAPLCSLSVGCQDDFTPVSKIESVRILAARADSPYVKPGTQVSVDLLASDERPEGKRQGEMKLYSLPAPCENPLDDLYYACYLGFANQFQAGADVTSQLIEGSRFTFQVSQNVITSHQHVEGSIPFGSIFSFSMACPGRVRYLGLRLSPSPQSPPFGCFDENGNAFDTNSFVFAFSRVFAFEERTNTNPEIESLTFNGQTFAWAELEPCTAPNAAETCPTATVNRCPKKDVEDCSKVKVNVSVPATSQEADPSSDVGREQLWADYYATSGKFEDDIRIIYDANTGRVSDAAVDFRLPQTVGNHKLWVVVHDNRGGLNWIQLRLVVQ